MLSITEQMSKIMSVDPIWVAMGRELAPLLETHRKDNLQPRIEYIRLQLASELGFLVPEISFRVLDEINPLLYVIYVRDVQAGANILKNNRFMAAGPIEELKKYNLKVFRDPIYHMPASWVKYELLPQIMTDGRLRIWHPADILANHLLEILRINAADIFDRKELTILLDSLREKVPLEDLIPHVFNLEDVLPVLQNLLREGLPIKDLPLILETIASYSGQSKDSFFLTEVVRQAMKKQITARYMNKRGKIYALALSDEVEELLYKYYREISFMTLSISEREELMTAVKKQTAKVIEKGLIPIIVTNSFLRPTVRRLTEDVIPLLSVLSYSEIAFPAQVEFIGTVSFSKETDVNPESQDVPIEPQLEADQEEKALFPEELTEEIQELQEKEEQKGRDLGHLIFSGPTISFNSEKDIYLPFSPQIKAEEEKNTLTTQQIKSTWEKFKGNAISSLFHLLTAKRSQLPSSYLAPDKQEITLQLGKNLYPWRDYLQSQLRLVTNEVTSQMGISSFMVSVFVNRDLEDNCYLLKLGNLVREKQVIQSDKLVMIGSAGELEKIPSARIESFFNLYKWCWVNKEDKEKYEISNVWLMESVDNIIWRVSVILLVDLADLFNSSMAYEVVAKLDSANPALSGSIKQNLMLADITMVLKKLLSEQVSLRDTVIIFDELASYSRKKFFHQEGGTWINYPIDIDDVVESIRLALSRHICQKYLDDKFNLTALTLHPSVETAITRAIKRDDYGYFVDLNPPMLDKITRAIEKGLSYFPSLEKQPVILCQPRLRPHLRKLIEKKFPLVAVLSYLEVPADVKINSLQMIGFEEDLTEEITLKEVDISQLGSISHLSREIDLQSFHSHLLGIYQKRVKELAQSLEDYAKDYQGIYPDMLELLFEGPYISFFPSDPASGKKLMYTRSKEGTSYVITCPNPEKYGLKELSYTPEEGLKTEF